MGSCTIFNKDLIEYRYGDITLYKLKRAGAPIEGTIFLRADTDNYDWNVDFYHDRKTYTWSKK